MSRSREIPSWFGWIFVAFGIFMMLLYFGIIEPVPKPKRRALLEGYSHWQVLCSALAFAGIGLTIAVHKAYPRLGRASALLGAACLFSVLTWALFFSAASWPLPVKIFGGFCLALGFGGVIGAQVQSYRAAKSN
jgi:CHASE2 domain-containing sensor protein